MICFRFLSSPKVKLGWECIRKNPQTNDACQIQSLNDKIYFLKSTYIYIYIYIYARFNDPVNTVPEERASFVNLVLNRESQGGSRVQCRKYIYQGAQLIEWRTLS